ncbi:sulfur carrier protein ThiS [Phycisphaerales bacterium AB-hyl4]|uniref:Sulfur carrier protein ThiS n=1 Tax=Natronomicrosphaera hydrolytica TaxID=3242702 RepID=A0ABV4U436_9BACT
MNVTLNGEKQDVNARTVRELVEQLGMGKQAVAVEVNRELVPRKLHDSTELNEGDVIELVTLVGGG